MASFWKAAWGETQRHSKLLSIQAQIEKLNRIDLRQALQNLGKKCYELRLGEDKFGTQFQEITSLEQRICEKRKGVHAAEDAKAVEKLRAAAEDQAGKLAAEGLNLKLGGLFAELGRLVLDLGNAVDLPAPELAGVRVVEARLNDLQSTHAKLVGDHTSRDEIKSASAGLRDQAKDMVSSTSHSFRWRIWMKRLIGFAVAVAILVALSLLFIPKGTPSVAATRSAWNAMLEAGHSQRDVMPLSTRFANLSLRYSQIDLTGTDSALVSHIRQSVDIFHDKRVLCESIEAEENKLKSNAEDLVGVTSLFGALFGAAAGDANNSPQNMQVGRVVGGELVGKGLVAMSAEAAVKDIYAKHKSEIERLATRSKELAQKEADLANKLSAKYQTTFINAR